MCFQFRNIKEIKILRLQGSNKSSGQMFPVGASWPLEQSETISFYLFIFLKLCHYIWKSLTPILRIGVMDMLSPFKCAVIWHLINLSFFLSYKST